MAEKYLRSPGLIAGELQILQEFGPQTHNGVGNGRDQTRPWAARTARPVPGDQASVPRSLSPNARARAAAPTRAIQTGEGRDSRPKAREKRELCTSADLDSEEPHCPRLCLKNGPAPCPTACLLAQPYLPEFTANSVAILEAN